jgi:hypothetical protein
MQNSSFLETALPVDGFYFAMYKVIKNTSSVTRNNRFRFQCNVVKASLV